MERREEQSKDKVTRIPFGGLRQRLQLSQADMLKFKFRKMVPCWFNDQDGRVEQAQAAGYKFVDPKHVPSVGHGALHGGNTDIGDKVSKIVTKGNDYVMRAYLMEIEKKFWDEDQASKEKVNSRVDEALALGGKGGADVEMAYRP